MRKPDPTRDALMAALSAQRPLWHIEWAEQADLFDLARGYASGDDIKTRVFDRIVPTVLNAAIQAGVVAPTE